MQSECLGIWEFTFCIFLRNGHLCIYSWRNNICFKQNGFSVADVRLKKNHSNNFKQKFWLVVIKNIEQRARGKASNIGITLCGYSFTPRKLKVLMWGQEQKQGGHSLSWGFRNVMNLVSSLRIMYTHYSEQEKYRNSYKTNIWKLYLP